MRTGSVGERFILGTINYGQRSKVTLTMTAGAHPSECMGSENQDGVTCLEIESSEKGEGNGSPLQYSCLENPRDGKPGGLPSVGLHRVGQTEAT